MNIEQAKGIPMSLIYELTNTKPEDYSKTFNDSLELTQAYLKSKGEDCTIVDSMRWIENMKSGMTNQQSNLKAANAGINWQIIRFDEVDNLALIQYLDKRGIKFSVAKNRLSELYIRNPVNNEKFYVLGFVNEDGGYHLFSPFVNGFAGARTISFIRGSDAKPKGIHIFKDFIDYFTFQTINKGHKHTDDVIVLNSISAAKDCYPYIKNFGYLTAYTWLTNENQGKAITDTLAASFRAENNLTHKPMNVVYKPHKDLNAWHMHNLNLIL